MPRIRSTTGKDIEVMQNQEICTITPEGIEVPEKQARFFCFGNPKTIERVDEGVDIGEPEIPYKEEKPEIIDKTPPVNRKTKKIKADLKVEV